MARPEGHRGVGKALVVLALSAFPMTGLIMWIGLSGGGRDVQAELHWLGALPEGTLGAPAPFDDLPPGTSFDRAQAKLPTLLAIDTSATGPDKAVLAYKGRTLARHVSPIEGGWRVEIESAAQKVTLELGAEPLQIRRILGHSMRPLEVPASWGTPEVLAPGTVAQRDHYAKDGLHFLHQRDVRETFELTTARPEIGTSTAALPEANRSDSGL